MEITLGHIYRWHATKCSTEDLSIKLKRSILWRYWHIASQLNRDVRFDPCS